MVKLKNINQKLNGKLQQIRGDIEIASGQPLKGNINKLKGKTNEVSADIKNNIDLNE